MIRSLPLGKSGLPQGQVHPIEINCNIYLCLISHSVIVTVVSPFHVSPFRYSMCRRFGYMCVAVLVCRRFDQLPHALATGTAQHGMGNVGGVRCTLTLS